MELDSKLQALLCQICTKSTANPKFASVLFTKIAPILPFCYSSTIVCEIKKNTKRIIFDPALRWKHIHIIPNYYQEISFQQFVGG